MKNLWELLVIVWITRDPRGAWRAWRLVTIGAVTPETRYGLR